MTEEIKKEVSETKEVEKKEDVQAVSETKIEDKKTSSDENIEKESDKKEVKEVKEDVSDKDAILNVEPGMVVRVHEKIKEKNTKGEEKERIQVFEGIIIAHKHGGEIGATITVRKDSNSIGVEKIFPINSPLIEKIELKSRIKSSKSKLYYLRNYKKRLRKVVVK